MNSTGFQVLQKSRKLAPKVKSLLEEQIKEEFLASQTYACQASMFMGMGYSSLANKMWKESQEEIKHAMQWLDRLHLFGLSPNVPPTPSIPVAKTVEEAIDIQRELESQAILNYNKLARLAREADDHETERLAVATLEDEEEHWDWANTQLEKIKQIGLQNYLAEQDEGDAAKAWA